MIELILIVIALALLWAGWRAGLNSGKKAAAKRLLEIEGRLSREMRVRELSVTKREEKILSKLESVRSDGVLLPSLVRWADQLQQAADDEDTNALLKKSRPARVAAESVREANQKARYQKQLADMLRNQIDLYESLAPWLREFNDLTVEEVIEGLKESLTVEAVSVEHPARKYLSSTEWNSLSETDRLQKSLNNYLNPSRKKSLWQVGIDFERYIGHLYEQRGFKVIFHGATTGVADLGIDLICSDKNELAIVQCKRLAAIKEIPVRENTVAQIFGAAEYYRLREKISKNVKVKPTLVTSYILSEQAKEFAKHLKVEVLEKVEITNYPTIKCNINPNTGEKIFHLPYDQQYDKVVIGDVAGECYVATVAEAINKGFRHAYRWQGSGQE
jgi:Holliday junction resolvase